MNRWSLRTSIVLLLIAATATTFLVLGGALLSYRLPAVAENSRETAQHQADELANLIEFYLAGIESRLAPAATLISKSPADSASALDALVGQDGAIEALYVVDQRGTVLSVGLPQAQRTRRADLQIGDFSSVRLFRSASENQRTQWSDKYLSAMSGSFVFGVAIPANERIVIAEISPRVILNTIQTVGKRYDNPVLVVDSRGEWIADNLGNGDRQLQNWAGKTASLETLRGRNGGDAQPLFGQPHYTGHAHSALLGWHFIVGIPAGFANADIRASLLFVGSGFAAALLASLLLAPVWAAGMTRTLHGLIERLHRLANGDFAPASRQASNIQEISQLADDLDRMAEAIRERELRLAERTGELRDSEQELLAIFNASPAAMTVSDINDRYRIVALNQAWERQFDRPRAQTLGRNGAEIGLWDDPDDRKIFIANVEAHGSFDNHEAWMLKSDGTRILCRLSGRTIAFGRQKLLIMVQEDITQQRQTETALQQLNSELETRVASRTADLERSNRELASALDHLRLTQSELVRSEKQAALGRLVAGVAHELNTPIGNALMASTTFRDQLRELRSASESGTLKRGSFHSFLDDSDTATDIVVRNLERSAALINSFKRVAIDQTSDQRRVFLLDETVAETLMILHPSLKRTPYRVETEIPAQLAFDSFPGALEQVLANLIHNAILHGFENRDHGTIAIRASQPDAEHVRIDVCDDGIGIAPDIQKRIFDPFFTTKFGRGGSGLGLHICHNAVTAILGGRIELDSTPGAGSCFSLHLPLSAPKPPAEDEKRDENAAPAA